MCRQLQHTLAWKEQPSRCRRTTLPAYAEAGVRGTQPSAGAAATSCSGVLPVWVTRAAKLGPNPASMAVYVTPSAPLPCMSTVTLRNGLIQGSVDDQLLK